MTNTPQIRTTVPWKIWIAIRFIFFGVGGVWISLLSIMLMLDPPGERWLSPYVAAPLSLVGALMMLYGCGQWGRWHYLWVFLSMPITITALFVVTTRFPNSQFLDSIWAKPLAIIWFVAPLPVTYLVVKGLYRRKDARLATATQIPADSGRQPEHS
jgi:hypothetical protein